MTVAFKSKYGKTCTDLVVDIFGDRAGPFTAREIRDGLTADGYEFTTGAVWEALHSLHRSGLAIKHAPPNLRGEPRTIERWEITG